MPCTKVGTLLISNYIPVIRLLHYCIYSLSGTLYNNTEITVSKSTYGMRICKMGGGLRAVSGSYLIVGIAQFNGNRVKGSCICAASRCS